MRMVNKVSFMAVLILSVSISACAVITGQKSGLVVTDDKLGTGAEALPNSRLSVHYTGWLYDPHAQDNKGRQFDSSNGGKPFTFILGRGQVIAGWDRGVRGMKVGGRRTLVIPPELGYGSRGAGRLIPGGATLIFVVELLQVDAL